MFISSNLSKTALTIKLYFWLLNSSKLNELSCHKLHVLMWYSTLMYHKTELM